MSAGSISAAEQTIVLSIIEKARTAAGVGTVQVARCASSTSCLSTPCLLCPDAKFVMVWGGIGACTLVQSFGCFVNYHQAAGLQSRSQPTNRIH